MDAVLGLEDGTIVHGDGFGREGKVFGELVFTTQYTGYEEALTDPSYAGQILMFAYPLIGNYGVSGERFQSNGIKAEGLVVHEACPSPSHRLSRRSIYDFIDDEKRCGISGIDTRMLTIKVREAGTMRSCLLVGTDDGEKAVELARNQPDIASLDLVGKVTCKKPYHIEGKGPRIVLIDCGVKQNIINNLTSRGVDLTVVPATTSVRDIGALEPDMLFLSNGPGDPQQATNAIEAVSHFAGTVPISGICLGTQIIALALEGNTYKLKFGHRGANQPVKDLDRGIVYITSQNHGFAVDDKSLENTDFRVTHINANDNTVEGIMDKYLDIASVQYHPEANPGPNDTEKIFFDSVLKRAVKK